MPYMLYEGLNLASQISREMGVFDRKLKGSHFIFVRYHFQTIKLSKYQNISIRRNKREYK